MGRRFRPSADPFTMVAVRRAHVEFRYGFAEPSPTTPDTAAARAHAAGLVAGGVGCAAYGTRSRRA